jgi:serine/threonine-protein kinase RsbW
LTREKTARAAFMLTSADIAQAIAWIAESATALGANERQSFRAQLSAEELIVNALDHGGRDRLSVCVTLGALPDRLRLTVEDDGGPFDLSEAEERKADAAVEAALPGGWGLQLVRRFAQDVRYERTEGRNVVVLDFTP